MRFQTQSTPARSLALRTLLCCENVKTLQPTVYQVRQQLMEIMSARFLNGDDSDFVNYAEIDTNETLNDFVEIQREAEERYF
ncbi:hypothetical protein PsorP6_010051 [Peronosclerospora sorghi]|uniref:Uncharacterized protein n=1 Tax=Peronosclerospora sorghi TaxID=230839 RepID=A0ACC0VT89_9STRA|nr:hypothetical protein PsorP6_010051 [Peronosclerospora sorghi]